jgi:hypothetical protein
MSETPRTIDLRAPHPSSLTAAGEAREAVCVPQASFRRRFHRTSGFRLGGALLAVGGSLLGICMPYSHPVAVTISVLWWGIYFGCFGASVGALLGLWAEQTAIPPNRPRCSDHSNHDEALGDINAMNLLAGQIPRGSHLCIPLPERRARAEEESHVEETGR